jgi:fimbrial chaperone protein
LDFVQKGKLKMSTFQAGLKNAVLFVAVLSSLTAHAISFTPIEMDFSPTGRGSTQIFRLENTTPDPVAVEVSMKSRAMKLGGEDDLQDADDQFNIFPSQVVMQPGQVQSIRVQYIGSANLDREKAFRLIAEQLPIDVGQAPTNGGRMRLLVKYVASVYVLPSKLKAVLSVSKLDVLEGKWLVITMQNRGKTRKILKDITIDIGAVSLSGADLKGLEGENILAETVREFRVPLPARPIDIKAAVKIKLI